MKIAHICNCLLGGGIENFLISLSKEQVKQGHDVSVIVIQQWERDYEINNKERLEQVGIKVYNLGKKRHSKISLFQSFQKCFGLVRNQNFDIINSHGTMGHYIAHFVGVFLNVRHVVTIHSAPEKWSKLLKIFCNRTPLIFCSDAALQLRDQSSTNMIAINNGIDPFLKCSSEKTDLRAEYNLKDTDKVVVLVGSLRPEKNYPFLKEIVSALNDKSFHFFICGGSYDKGYLTPKDLEEETIHPLELRNDIVEIENGADLFLSCSLKEGLPISVLEAYFSGASCVLSPILQMKNISDVPFVWIPEAFTAESFAITIKEACQNIKSHEEILCKRQRSLERFLIENCAKYYLDFYKTLLN